MTKEILETLVSLINTRLFTANSQHRMHISFKGKRAAIKRTTKDVGVGITWILEDETFTHVNYYLVGVIAGLDMV